MSLSEMEARGELEESLLSAQKLRNDTAAYIRQLRQDIMP